MSEALAFQPGPRSPSAAIGGQVVTPIPFKRDDAAGPNVSAGAVGVLVVSLLAIVVVQIMRKRLKLLNRVGVALTSLRVLESRRLGPKAILTVVEFGGVQHLLAYSEHGIQTIASIEAGQPDKEQGPCEH